MNDRARNLASTLLGLAATGGSLVMAHIAGFGTHLEMGAALIAGVLLAGGGATLLLVRLLGLVEPRPQAIRMTMGMIGMMLFLAPVTYIAAALAGWIR